MSEQPTRKPLLLTPQIAVAGHGLGTSDAELVVEMPNASGSRKKVKLTPENAYGVLLEALTARAAQIEAERAAAEAERRSTRRATAQPDWFIIARHPQAVIIERLPTRSSELAANRADHSLEEMGL